MMTANSDLIHPPAALRQRREERPGPQPPDLKLQITRGRGQRPRPVPAPLSCAGLSPLMRERADHRAELGLNQGLTDRLGHQPDLVINLSGLQCLQHLQQCRLAQGHRGACVLSRNPLAWIPLTITRWPSRTPQARRHHQLLTPASGDVTPVRRAGLSGGLPGDQRLAKDLHVQGAAASAAG
jgi:hypothetical protein